MVWALGELHEGVHGADVAAVDLEIGGDVELLGSYEVLHFLG